MGELNGKIENIISKILIWLPSILLTLFYVPNGLDKLFNHAQTGKIVESSTVMIIAGCFILIGTVLFLINKTIIIGTCFLVLYMTFVVVIHIYRDKPAEIVMLVLIATVFATYLRRPKLFYTKKGNE